jgi:hypothetical protein
MPVCSLSVHLIAAVLTGEKRPQALALLRGRLPCPYLPYFPSQLDLCLRVGTKVEIPRGVVLLPSIGRNHNNGFSFSEPEDRSGSALAALPPSCSEENDWASHRAAENPSARQPIDCSMERVEEASGSQFPQHHIPEAVQSPHAGSSSPIPLVEALGTRLGNRRHTAATAETKDYARASRRAVDLQPRDRSCSAVSCPAQRKCAPAARFQQWFFRRPFRLNHLAEAARGQTEA